MNRINKFKEGKKNPNTQNENEQPKNESRIINTNTTYTRKNNNKHRLLKNIFFFIIFLIIFSAIKTGISISSWQKMASDMVHNSPSVVLDTDGKQIAEIGNSKINHYIEFNDIPKALINAYISIEDQRFYKHSGVDLPRTGAAIISYLKNMGSSSFGGSSITQQLVKNLTGDKSSKVTRKVKEWIKAFALEGTLSKDEILEAYLNIIYVGPNIYGIEKGSEYYFNKSINELSLEECAFLAGINNSPNSYSPFSDKDNNELIKRRTTTVLSKMLELNYISETEYNSAVDNVNKGLKFKKGKINSDNTSSIYSYHTDALINEIIEDISKRQKISTTFAQNYIEMAGLKIYSTQDSTIQSAIEKEIDKPKYKLKSKNDSKTLAQAAMVIINNDNGQVVGCVGGIGEKTYRGFNRATQAVRQTGSAGKPLSVLAPAIDKKIITSTSLYVDEATTFDDGTDEGYSPTDYNDYRGEITVRQAVESSQNIPFVKIMEQLTPKESIHYMKKLGITTLTKKDENLNLALGGLDKGISPLEMASAYSVIANNGVYIEPTFYIKVENNKGKTITKSKQKTKKVMSKQVAFILQSLLKEPVEGSKGTARYCKMTNVDVAAKTGTTNNDYDRWLCGFTPYYTAVTWFGFDLNERIHFNNKNPSGQIWSSVMKTIHANLSEKTFSVPKNIDSFRICKDTGLLANSSCPNSYTEYYLKETYPTLYCSKHTGTHINELPDDSSEPETKNQGRQPTAEAPSEAEPSKTPPQISNKNKVEQANPEPLIKEDNSLNTDNSVNINSTQSNTVEPYTTSDSSQVEEITSTTQEKTDNTTVNKDLSDETLNTDNLDDTFEQ